VEKETNERTEPQRDEVLVLLELLDKEILKRDRSKRRLERDLGVGQGYVGSLLRGRITLKVEHLWDFGDAIGFEPLVLFFLSASKEHQERFLEELELTREIPDADSDAIEAMSRDEIEELVRKVVRQEMARMATS
jgi:transcriptional regulator with XRE-family HTH domain